MEEFVRFFCFYCLAYQCLRYATISSIVLATIVSEREREKRKFFSGQNRSFSSGRPITKKNWSPSPFRTTSHKLQRWRCYSTEASAAEANVYEFDFLLDTVFGGGEEGCEMKMKKWRNMCRRSFFINFIFSHFILLEIILSKKVDCALLLGFVVFRYGELAILLIVEWTRKSLCSAQFHCSCLGCCACGGECERKRFLWVT